MKNSQLLICCFMVWTGSVMGAPADSVRQAIQRADFFFKQHRHQLSTPVLMMMNYACHYYHVKPPVHAACLARRKLNRKDAYKQAFFKRLVKPSFRLSQVRIDSMKNTTDRLALYALYCDQIGLPSDKLYKMMIDLAGEGNPYHVSHALLGFHLAEQHGCISPADHEYEPVSRMLQSGAENILHTNLSSYDRKFELYAFLRLSGIYAHIPDEVTEQVVQTQKENGSWPVSSTNDTPSDHTSLLAYLILLQAMVK